MDIREYISSGILELYVFGSLSGAEMKEVEELAALHPEIRDEIRNIEAAAEGIAMANAVKPSDHVRDHLLNAVGNNSARQETPVRAINSNRFPYMAAAMLAAVLLSGNVYFLLKWQRTEEQLAQLTNEISVFASNFQQVKLNYENMEQSVALMTDPETKKVSLKGMEVSPQAAATVYWHPRSGRTMIAGMNLPAPPEGKQYQLWALADGKPVDAGVFRMEGNMQVVNTVLTADAFAVTLENAGGSPVPTLEKMYLQGSL